MDMHINIYVKYIVALIWFGSILKGKIENQTKLNQL